MPIALALALTGLGGVWLISGRDTALYVFASAPIEALSNYTLSVLPLFILMGAFAVKGGLSESLYRFAYSLVGHRRGGLAMAGIGACAGFGAICGSSMAAATTMTRLLAPEMLRYGYSPKLAAGTIAAGGTLSILIPPSLLMIVYAFLTESSIGQLFAAGIVPGILAAALYIGTIWVWTGLRPGIGPAGQRATWRDRLTALRNVWSVLALVVLVLGGIFAGLFAPTEGAAIGAAGALALGIVLRKIDWRGFVDCIAETVILSAMLLFIVVGVSFFNYFVEATRMPTLMVAMIEARHWPPFAVICAILLVLVVLGCFMDLIAIVFITTPVLFPLVRSMGYDPVWYGIITVMVVEFGLVTPPFGLNVFVVAKMIPEVTTWGAFQGVMPFILSDILRLAVLIVFPGLVLWLPRLIYGAGDDRRTADIEPPSARRGRRRRHPRRHRADRPDGADRGGGDRARLPCRRVQRPGGDVEHHGAAAVLPGPRTLLRPRRQHHGGFLHRRALAAAHRPAQFLVEPGGGDLPRRDGAVRVAQRPQLRRERRGVGDHALVAAGLLRAGRGGYAARRRHLPGARRGDPAPAQRRPKRTVTGGKAMPDTAHVPETPAAVAPDYMAHVVLYTRQFEEMIVVDRLALGAEVMLRKPTICFMTFDREHHRIAIIHRPNFADRPPETVGVAHIAWSYRSLARLATAYERLRAAGVLRCGRSTTAPPPRFTTKTQTAIGSNSRSTISPRWKI